MTSRSLIRLLVSSALLTGYLVELSADSHRARLVVVALFALVWAVGTFYNDWVLIAWLVRRRRIGSWIPFAAGVAGALALGFAPAPDLRRWWPVPLLLDWGSVPGVTFSLLRLWSARRRQT